MLLSPYDTTLWIDLDCEICGNIEPIFQHLSGIKEISLIKDPGRENIYNSGVVLFKKTTKLIESWSRKCLSDNAYFIGDDYILSPLIDLNKHLFEELPTHFHWMAALGMNPDALILHWASNWGKLFIETTGGYQDYKNSLLQNCLFTSDSQ